MGPLLRDRVASVLLLLGACAVGPAAVLHFFGGKQVQIESTVHFLPIVVSAGIAAAAAVALTAVGARRGDGRAVVVGTAFSAMAALLAVHGLTTPGMLVGNNGVVAFSGAATLPLGGAVLALAAVPGLRGPRSVRPILWIQGALLALVVGLGAAGILLPSLVPSVPEAASPLAIAMLAAGLCFYGIIAIRAARTYFLTRRAADLLVLAGLVVLAAALVPALVLGWRDLGWWIGHGLELVGVGMVGVPVALDLHRGVQSRPLMGDLRGAELVEAADAFLGPTVRSLLVRLAEKDAYTETHTRRVALLAVQVGEELGLHPARLRELAVGGILHDIGKLSVPDAILQKPGALDDDEYAVIRRHPERGRDLLGNLGGFSPAVARLVLDHHERLDGAGYPRGLHEDRLNLETRVLTVCDVFDALCSRRVYRDAWSREQALELLRRETGTAFDPRCVAALERVLEGDRRAVAEVAGNGRSLGTATQPAGA
jgi:HD-GYP domain-containing protein (c-di-GMP phosphodiesterase class II)